MELYDEKLEKKKSKIPMIIGICIVILVAITSLVIYGIIYLKDSITIVTVDGLRNNLIEEVIYIAETEEGLQLYMPIIKVSQFLGFEGFIGDYKNKSEDNTKCHVINKNETIMFTQDSNVLVKIRQGFSEYVEIDIPVFERNGELYISTDGFQKAFNMLISSNEKFKNIEIWSMDYLVQYYAQKLKINNYSNNFTDKKAVLEGLMIVEENGKYGVIDVINMVYILESKYDSISYLPEAKNFLVKSNGKYGTVTREKTIKIKNVYDEIKTMHNQNGLYLVKQNNAYGVVNVEGEIIIKPEYNQIGINIDNYAKNGVENQYILLDEIIPIKNNEGLWGFYNIKEAKMTDFKYTGIGCKSTPANNSYPSLVIPSHKLVVVEKDKHYNLMTLIGDELITGYILDSVYLKTNIETEQNEYFMTSSNNTKVINIDEWLTKIGR